jgi:preprotein translocase subunit SecD
VFSLSENGSARLAHLTAANIGRPLAVVIDNSVIAAPVIRSEISAIGQIDLGMQATEADAEYLALLLRHGPYSRPLTMTECRLVQQ